MNHSNRLNEVGNKLSREEEAAGAFGKIPSCKSLAPSIQANRPREQEVKGTITHSEGPKQEQYLTIYQSELRVVCGLAALWPGLETGGDLFGLYTRGNRAICHLSTGPGAGATHEVAHFSQDIEFCRRAQEVLGSNYGLQWIGTWHSHHSLGIDEPSGGDLQQVMAVSSKNKLGAWCEMILTFDRVGARQTPYPYRPAGNIAHDGVAVRVNPFVYTDPHNGKNVIATVRILPGVSPIRQSLLTNSKLTPLEIAEHASSFPREHILLESVDSAEPEADVRDFPQQIATQIEELPEEIQEQLSIVMEQRHVVVTLPFTEAGAAEISLCLSPPYCVETVRMLKEGIDPEDITEHLKTIGEEARLAQVYRALTSAETSCATSGTASQEAGGIVGRLRRKRRPSSSGGASLV